MKRNKKMSDKGSTYVGTTSPHIQIDCNNSFECHFFDYLINTVPGIGGPLVALTYNFKIEPQLSSFAGFYSFIPLTCRGRGLDFATAPGITTYYGYIVTCIIGRPAS